MLFLYFMTVWERKRWKHIIIMALILLEVYVNLLRYQVKWVYYTSTIMVIVLAALELWLGIYWKYVNEIDKNEKTAEEVLQEVN